MKVERKGQYSVGLFLKFDSKSLEDFLHIVVIQEK